MLAARSFILPLALVFASPSCAPNEPPFSSGEDAGPSADKVRCPADEPIGPDTVRIDLGLVRGVSGPDGVAFRGIPYAAPPTGSLRFAPPKEAACFDDVFIASRYGPPCPQAQGSLIVGEEECLTLNVFVPPGALEGEALLPVLVFLHGGANVFGSSADRFSDGTYLYDGMRLANAGPAVVVTVNYRLGALGFLAHEALSADDERGVSGNYGLLDQMAALAFVQRNIEAFGGDPERVLLFGESAGALDTCALLASPLADGLFTRALLQSGGCGARPLDKQELSGRQVVAAVGCEGDDDVASCLRQVPVESFVASQANAPPEDDVWGFVWGPTIDGVVLDDYPLAVIARGEHNPVPLVVGSNRDETSIWAPALETCDAYEAALAQLFGVRASEVRAAYPCEAFETPKEAFIAVTTDVTFTCPARALLRAAGSDEAPAFRYLFAHGVSYGPAAAYGAFHAAEIGYVFGHLSLGGYVPTAKERALSAAVQGYWTRFARAGDPNGEGAVPWPVYDAKTDPYLIFDETLSTGEGLGTEQCDFWASFRAGG